MTMVSLDGDWVDSNDALCRLLGRSHEELRGRVVEAITHPDDLSASTDHMERLIARGSGSYTLEKRYLHADGTPVEAQLTATLIPGFDGEPRYVLGQVVDLTRIRRVQHRLQRTVADLVRSNDTLASFAEVLSHDLTSPLGTARGFVQTVLLRHADDLASEVVDLLERAERQTDRALATASSLLQLAGTGTTVHDPAEVELGPLLAEVIDGFTHEIAELEATVTARATCTVIADPVLLQLVLQNLVANALKYRHPDRRPEVEISCARLDDEVHIHVDDNGIGMPDPDEVERLFERGTRDDRDGSVYGLGLGLATCRRIAEVHGGDIRVADRPAGGTRMTVVLPAG